MSISQDYHLLLDHVCISSVECVATGVYVTKYWLTSDRVQRHDCLNRKTDNSVLTNHQTAACVSLEITELGDASSSVQVPCWSLKDWITYRIEGFRCVNGRKRGHLSYL